MKKSAGVMDLSKFLTPSDEEIEDEPLNRSNTNEDLDQRISDSVENLVSEAEVSPGLLFVIYSTLDIHPPWWLGG